jgi:primosomal protein N''
VDVLRYEARAFWMAAVAAHRAYYAGETDSEAVDELDLIAQVAQSEQVRERCRTVLRKLEPGVAVATVA